VGSRHQLRVLFFLDYDDGLGGRFPNSPGLLPLIGYTRQCGFDVEFVSDAQELLQLAEDPRVDVVAISSMERLLVRSLPVATQVRALRPDVVLMLGGNSIEAFAQDMCAALLDVVAVGEGEFVFPALLRAVAAAKGCALKDLPGPHFRLPASVRKVADGDAGGAISPGMFQSLLRAAFQRRDQNGTITEIGVSGVYIRDGASGEVWQASGTPSAPLGTELDELCVMPWDVVDARSWEVLEFYTQRGCSWGRCEFCSINDRNIRALSHDKILEVLRHAPAHGITTVSFSDDLFVQKGEWNRTLLERIVALDLGLKFRAQTMANRSVWPLLGLMRQAGFAELAFGVETLSPERARFMVKSFDGRRYVENAKETIERVAAAGILPVLYMILLDPRTTLLEAATELRDAVLLLETVYARTGILPKLSFNPAMLPVMGPVMTTRFPYRTKQVQAGSRTLQFPSEFELNHSLSLMVYHMAQRTDDMPYRRENLAIMLEYLDSALEAARESADVHASDIADLRAETAERMKRLEGRLREDIRQTTDLLLGRRDQPEPVPGWPEDERRLDFARFGGYIDGWVLYSDLLAQGTGGG
jgi:Radical SAM superfamily/B12 binding domain